MTNRQMQVLSDAVKRQNVKTVTLKWQTMAMYGFCKYADDTYLVIPASNVDSRTREIENIRSWSCANNLNLNLKKSSEIVFVDSMRRCQIQLPSLLEALPRVCSLKILGIKINSHFSVSEHVSCVIWQMCTNYSSTQDPSLPRAL